MIKLGSLFDGSGGFPLAGCIHGVTPVWASEIEPYPVRVTTARFPNMTHLGDVTKIDGAAIEPVDIITFGSPCQDLSVAGKQAGLHKGERSNLFFEAIRIIKEMRESTNGIYPRIAIWENVPGAYSSNKGEDFRAVLEAFCSIKDETADVPRPASGKWNPAGAIVGNGWSVAWRTLDAQYWGVPQRRKRIYLIADFGGERAGEILFEQEGLRGHSAESGTAGEGAAGDAEGSVGGSLKCLTPWDVQSKRIYQEDSKWPGLCTGKRICDGSVLTFSAGDAEGSVGGSDSFVGFTNRGFVSGNVTETLRADPHGAFPMVAQLSDGNCLNPWDCQSKRIFTTNGTYPTLPAMSGGGANNQAICFQASGDRDNPSISTSEKAYCIPANPMSDRGQAVCFQQNQREEVRLRGEKTGAIAANGGAHQTNYIMFKERAGCPGGGKGILCGDKPFTLSTLTDQAVCYAYDQYNGAIADKQASLGTNCGMSTGRNGVCYSAGFKAGQSKDASIGWQEECAATLSAQASGTEPTVCYALQGNGIDRADTAGCNGAGWRENECYTLNTIDRPAVCYPIDLIRESRGAFEAYDEGAKIGGSLKQSDNKGSQVVCYPIDSHQQDSRFRVCEDGVCPTVPGQMGTGGNNGPMVLEKCAWDGSQICSTLTANNAGGNRRMPDKENFNAVIEKVRKLNATDKKAGCREILLGLWGAYVEETLQRDTGKQPGIQQTEVLRSEVYGSALDEQTQDRNELHGESCHCEEGKGCWVLRNMREAEREGRASQGRQLSEQQPGQLDADLQELPQQAAQDGEEMQGLRGESQRAGILREALSKVQEIWQPTCNKNQPIQRKYIIRRLTPLEACRLQGFPDWWEHLAPYNPADAAFWEGVRKTHAEINGKAYKPVKNLKKWYDKLYADSARYKMWGNGLALPNAAHVVGCAVKLIKEETA